MLRSASLAAFDLFRTCCSGFHASNPNRATRRIHDVHCGSIAGVPSDAIERYCVRLGSHLKMSKLAREIPALRLLASVLASVLVRVLTKQTAEMTLHAADPICSR